jgi:hypothetical protein
VQQLVKQQQQQQRTTVLGQVLMQCRSS